MADAIRSKVIRADVVSAYSHCPRKAFLLHCTEERGTPHEYQVILEGHTNVRRTSYLAALQKTSASIRSYSERLYFKIEVRGSDSTPSPPSPRLKQE
jgi:hypothetical protein